MSEKKQVCPSLCIDMLWFFSGRMVTKRVCAALHFALHLVNQNVIGTPTTMACLLSIR